MSVVFHVTLLNILGFVHLPEKVLDKYFEIQQETHLDTKNEKTNTLSWILRVLQNVVH
jgi:hypothetical protein